MPASYYIDAARSILCVEHVGETEPAQVYSVIDRMLADPRVRPGLQVVSDHSRETTISTIAGALDTLPRVIEFLDRMGSFRLAIVATRSVQIGMVHFSAVYARRRGIEMRAFRDRKEAEAWLLEERPEDE